ncbi:hypothetical protein TD95_003198 [Thielaviopsis punctulata]|uniref:Uncharacterized protein n=1 Tax=Thielaviopsis punctulata TaxID=72032 RepID=A0A0F4ZBW7_9PEZI|nr:hypothetical protein TD95_003198 [Thielaviopsis punctulata]
MDVSDFEADVWLQKASAELLADLRHSLPKLLRKPADANGTARLRYQVRMREVSRLDSLVLDQFLELPQLLDPHLAELVPQLASAYLEFLQTRGLQPQLRTKSHLIEPLSQAVARLLYTFCKIRGEKVIVRFLNVETKYLELLLSAIEADYVLGQTAAASLETDDPIIRWTWQERYVILLWLSQLLFAPFDLSTISSVDLEDLTVPSVPHFVWPPNLPGIAVRLIPMGVKYLEAPGKERDGAKALLVRMSMRRDMQQLGVLQALVSWALESLSHPGYSAYYYNGRLGYLAGVLRASVDTSDMDAYLVRIFRAVFALTMSEGPAAQAIMASSVARKMIIKVLRSVTVLVLRRDSQDDDAMELVETCITFLMERLADNDTPVRFAASKALSIITLRLAPDMAEQVVEAVLEALAQKVLWVSSGDAAAPKTRDISAVDPLEWHGLMLTLSHLLYRRSPPAEQLPAIIHALLLGLSFEQRGPTGASVGTNVRDAACFGIWAISRRYTTAELLAVSTDTVIAAHAHTQVGTSSIIQVLATELVVAASRDPAGNIRRGASAALQELIGRHPDTVVQGISVVQTVDYNAVALRSRAIHQVSLKATELSSLYGEALQAALLTWRGVGDGDAAARRVTGTSFGTLTLQLARMQPDQAVRQFTRAVDLVERGIRRLQARQAEERHGLVLCLAALLDQVPALWELAGGAENEAVRGFVCGLLDVVARLLGDIQTGTFRREELLAEAASRLSVSLLAVIQAVYLSDTKDLQRLPGSEIIKTGYSDRVCAYVSALDSCITTSAGTTARISALANVLGSVLQGWLDYDDQDTVDAVSAAGLVYLILSPAAQRPSIVQTWADVIRSRQTTRSSHGHGYFYAVAMSYPVTKMVLQASGRQDSEVISHALLGRWIADRDVETHVAILQSLTQSDTLRHTPMVFLDILAEGLDNYTTNARGDVGSLVRVAALKATKSLWKHMNKLPETAHEWLRESVRRLFPAVLRLAAEKLDRVRAEAHHTLALAIDEPYKKGFFLLTFSSQKYFYTLLSLYTLPYLNPLISQIAKADEATWMAALLSGFVTSAETGNEVLVVNSRAALTQFASSAPANLSCISSALAANIKAFQGTDRVLVSSLEITAFLLHANLFACAAVDARSLCTQAQKATYKSGNMRKIEACVKIYGGVARLAEHVMGRSQEAVVEARKRLGALMFHPWPKVRNLVVDEIWMVVGEDEKLANILLGVNWSAAKKDEIRAAVGALGLE